MADAADIQRLQDGWLGRQPAAFRAALMDAITWRHADVGATINYAGEETGGIWGIARGQIDTISALGAVDSPIADIYLPGTWGGIAPILGRSRVSDCTVRVTALLAVVPMSRLHTLLHANPQWWECISQLTMDYAIRYGSATGDLLIRESRRRCIAVLLRLGNCRHIDPATPPTIVISHSDFAAAANLSRHPAGEILRDLQEAGHIALGYRQITIVNAAALRAIVDG